MNYLTNIRLLEFYGTANGNLLTRNYQLSDIKNRFLKIFDIKFKWFTGSGYWLLQSAYDNKTMSVNANTRYEVVNNNLALLPGVDRIFGTGNYKLLVNGNPINIFSIDSFSPAYDKIDINSYLSYEIDSGIDFKVNMNFIQDFEASTIGNPLVYVMMRVEILSQQELAYIQANPFDVWKVTT